MESSSEFGLDSTGDFTPTRHSSKLSLGSSPSILSGDEVEEEEEDTNQATDGGKHRGANNEDNNACASDQDHLTTGDNNGLGNDNDNDNDDKEHVFDESMDLSAEELDDQDSASPLSSVPEDFPLSRSASPEIQEDDEENNPLLLLSSISVTSSPSSSLVADWAKKCKNIQSHGSNDPDVDDTTSDAPPLCNSRRMSMIEKDLLSAADIENTNGIVEEDTTNDESLLISTKYDNNTNTTPLLSKGISLTPSHYEESYNVLLETNDNEEKENTPISSNKNRNYTNLLEDLENISTHEEDWDTQQRHKDALEALTHIEIEFARLREKMYQEKMAKLNEEAIMIANGTHPELVTLMAEIEEKKGRRISTAEAWRKYQHANFSRQFEGFEYQANVHFISRKSAIRRELLASTNGKRWRLEDEQGKLNDPMQRSIKLIPDVQTLGTQKQIKRKKTMDLQDIKDVIGFPRAPQVPGLSQQDIQDDLLVLGLGASRTH